jgi:hypothetical protein
MRTITLEEHFATPDFLDGPSRDLKEQARPFGGRAEQLIRDLSDLSEGRIAQMDAAGIDVQVVSLTAPAQRRRPMPSLVAAGQSKSRPACRPRSGSFASLLDCAARQSWGQAT